MKDENQWELVVSLDKQHIKQFNFNVKYIFENLGPKKIIIIANKNLEKEVIKHAKIEFLDEDSLLPGMTLQKIKIMIPQAEGRCGWYFQQFLKMAYAYNCNCNWYLVWDADTIPLKKMRFFSKDQKVYANVKTEYHKPYFDTLKVILDGRICKAIPESFIAEHMMISKKVMLEMIREIEKNCKITGDCFYEKIINAIEIKEIPYSGFSEFETYGNYAWITYPELYRKRQIKSFRYAKCYFYFPPLGWIIKWLKQDFDTVSFEKWQRTSLFLFVCGNIFFFLGMGRLSFLRFFTLIKKVKKCQLY